MMKKVLMAVLVVAALGTLLAFTLPTNAKNAELAPINSEEEVSAEKIKWYTWDEAIALNKEEPRKLFIDLYTDWCGWCKRMDATTFTDPKVVEHLNKNYYPIKFDAEQKEEVIYNDYTFKFIAQGRRGVDELAYSLLDGQLSYPSYVYLNEQVQRLYVSKGYKPADQFMKELDYFTTEQYMKQENN